MIFITLLNFNTIVYATDVIDDVKNNDGKYYEPSDLGDEPKLKEKAGTILGVINVVGVVVSVVTLMVVGIKYMMGSVEEKAEYKKTMGMYLIGAFLVFSITTLPNILYKISEMW